MIKRDTRTALIWINDILGNHNIPFVIDGGFAANLYGATRELADIDIVIPRGRTQEIFEEIKSHSIFGPAQYHDENWDLYLTTLQYQGQEIDICENETTTIFDQQTKEWIPLRIEPASAVRIKAFDLDVLVIKKEDLIAYKKKLAREVDLEDVKQLSS